MLTSKPTFRQQYDKIVGAYLRNELEPLVSCACFVGNLLNSKYGWGTGKHSEISHNFLGFCGVRQPDEVNLIEIESNCLYSSHDISLLEYNFLRKGGNKIGWTLWKNHPDYEASLFRAMESTLILLRQIHESKGEVIEDYSFTKRELQNL